MRPKHRKFDFIIIGGGLFGVYAAYYLSSLGAKVAVVEKESGLMKKASIVNQARLHGGYHYPRSVATARMSDENKQRFTEEHRDFILADYEKYYAIDRFGSFTDAAQFERFCAHIGLPCRREFDHPLFNYRRLEAVYRTVEYTFDPILIAQYYRELLERSNGVELLLSHRLKKVNIAGSNWELTLVDQQNNTSKELEAPQVINATYSASNTVNHLFGLSEIDLMHEIAEMAFVTSPEMAGIGLTVMDGPFGSIMPYGLSGLLSVSSVAYTHHKVSYDAFPTFDCQRQVDNCRPDFTSVCNGCRARPRSNFLKMQAQMKQYLGPHVQLNYFSSMYTIKSKLKANYIDDGRPTEISILRKNPHFYCIFAGKINSIYEIEKIVEP